MHFSNPQTGGSFVILSSSSPSFVPTYSICSLHGVGTSLIFLTSCSMTLLGQPAVLPSSPKHRGHRNRLRVGTQRLCFWFSNLLHILRSRTLPPCPRDSKCMNSMWFDLAPSFEMSQCEWYNAVWRNCMKDQCIPLCCYLYWQSLSRSLGCQY